MGHNPHNKSAKKNKKNLLSENCNINYKIIQVQ